MHARQILMVLIAALLLPAVSLALIRTQNRGRWPDTWPKELEGLRAQAKTIDVAHGIQETVYEIPFKTREEFEEAWPHVLKVKSPEGVLILDKSNHPYNRSGSKLENGVRILWPAIGKAGRDGKMLSTSGPWPESARLANGELAEYVVIQDDTWVPSSQAKRVGFLNRARVDIMLIVDGQIVDLNRTPLPANTKIVDRRFEEGR